jgi:hypothetical protein
MQHTDRDHLGLLYDIGELTALIRESTDIPNLLERTVMTISKHLKAEVCSIYLYDQETRELVLKATKGLHPQAVEKVRIGIHALSVDPHHLPKLQRRISALTFAEAQAYAEQLLAEASLAGTQAVIRSGVRPGKERAAAEGISPEGQS